MGLQRNLSFFGLLRAFEPETFFTEALVVLGATSGSTGSSTATGEGGGTAVAHVGGSSSSLHEKYEL
jgi:hypothetical protein